MPELSAPLGPGEHPSRRPAVVAGASAGIGADIARVLGAEGYPIALGARRVERCDAIAAEIRAAGGEAFGYQLDVADTSSVDAFAKEVADRYGDVEILVANAGTMQPGALAETDPEDFAASVNINLVGVQRLVHAFLPGMVARQRGDFVLISSEVVDRPRPLVGTYVASKWGAEGLARTLQLEMEGTGVRVSIVQPGPTASEIATGWEMDDAMAVVRQGKKFGSLRHFGFLQPAAIARTVAQVVGAPRGTHIAFSYVAPEAPIDEVKQVFEVKQGNE
jgi:NADP-dependent 3-hydroxy acid dehydrogenase YdfG